MRTVTGRQFILIISVTLVFIFGNYTTSIMQSLNMRLWCNGVVYAQSNELGSVAGVISSRSSGRMLSDAKVELLQNGVSVLSVTTLNDGSYGIEFPVGNYELLVSKRGFKTANSDITISSTETLTENIALTPIQAESSVDQTIKTSGAQTGSTKTTNSIFGFVNGEVKEAATGFSVLEALVSLSKAGNTIVSELTPEDGVYFFEVRPGKYVLSAEKEGFDKKSIEVSLSAFDRTVQDIALDVEGFPGEETPTPTPTFTLTPTVTPDVTPTPFLGVGCEGGGVPGFMRVDHRIIYMVAGSRRTIKIRVRKEGVGQENIEESGFRDRRQWCVTNVNVECISGESCDKIELAREKIVTNRRGKARMVIRANPDIKGVVKLKLIAGSVERIVTVIITPNILPRFDDNESQ